jgi:hypothetical protein
VDETPIDSSKYILGMEKLPEILPQVREAAKKLFLDRLQ